MQYVLALRSIVHNEMTGGRVHEGGVCRGSRFSDVLPLEAVVVWPCRVLASKIDELEKSWKPNKEDLCVPYIFMEG